MSKIPAIFKRELTGYFETPVAYVFIVVFLLLNGMFTFYIGNFYENGQSDLIAFFRWHPWLYLFLIPAVSMRLWAEERKSGTIELLLTLPIKTHEAILGKYLAAWCFTCIAMLLTFPIWITVNVLGKPDNGIIFLSYIGSLLMAASFLSIGSCMSSLTRNQVVSFVISVTVCFIFTVSGFPIVLDFFIGLGFPQVVVDTVSSFSFLSNFEEIMQGVFSLKNFIFFISFSVFWLFVNYMVINTKRV
jgi:ABC-2 type transport system permease protein